MLFLTGLVFCSAFVLTKSSVIDHSDDFYWRDYNGEVPKDALPGGMDRDHNPTYIGQAVSSSARGITYYPQITSLGALVPGQIIRGVKKMYYYGDYSPRVETENIKIFCTKHPENFEWVKTNINDVKYLSKIRLIPENTLAVGKVIVPNDSRSSYFKTSVNDIYLFIKFSVSNPTDHSDDFYWRDYNGEVPKDALPGGMDRDHKPTYIGQVVYSGVLVPGHIISGVKKMYYYGDYSARVETENIKILCTKHPDNFEWIKSNGNDVKSQSRMRLIPGGFSNGEEVYIGRGLAENLLVVGKVIIPTDSRNGYIKIGINGNSYAPDEFEVLNYRLRNIEYKSNSTKKMCNVSFIAVILFLLYFFY
ncbi:hypothetical protein RN001_014327 [Aquatica leii]|uniref:Uncharacterized protein n=1 Tax=Aquatica leii TaxID=1421715 RepID=A0AAN7SCT5_9COLE|nr:hypothetical protein RN001_014327 [Aquatica leii]